MSNELALARTRQAKDIDGKEFTVIDGRFMFSVKEHIKTLGLKGDDKLARIDAIVEANQAETKAAVGYAEGSGWKQFVSSVAKPGKDGVVRRFTTTHYLPVERKPKATKLETIVEQASKDEEFRKELLAALQAKQSK